MGSSVRRQRPWYFGVLWLAGGYNILWGAWVGLWPQAFFEFMDLENINYPVIWQGMGMVIGLYGLGYIISAYDIYRHWPIILIGFLGKVIGPIGFFIYAAQGLFPWEFIYTHITNDLIWWIPFSIILLKIYQKHKSGTDS